MRTPALGRSGLAAASLDIHPLNERAYAPLPPPRQGDQLINLITLIILIIFVKQRTYLARPPPAEPPNLKRTQKYQILQIVE
jgi:hypothetical protein